MEKLFLLLFICLLSTCEFGKKPGKQKYLVFWTLLQQEPVSYGLSCMDHENGVCLKLASPDEKCPRGFTMQNSCPLAKNWAYCSNALVMEKLQQRGTLYYYPNSLQTKAPFRIKQECTYSKQGTFVLKERRFETTSGEVFAGSCLFWDTDVCIDYYSYEFADRSCIISRGESSYSNPCQERKQKCKYSLGDIAFLWWHYGNSHETVEVEQHCQELGGQLD
ncbi:MAG: hypothetical protein AAF518_10305 [Spirochaetota bacterium]